MRAAELIFTGEPIGAAEAERLGLITRMVPAEKLADETIRLASRIAAMSPLALARTRSLLYQMEDMGFDEVPVAAPEAVSAAFDSDDSKEARLSFLEKRKPVWTGK
jgi:enoyl-CoA hydratase/carnithine racemase